MACALSLLVLGVAARADTAGQEDLKYQKAIDAATDKGLSYLAKQQQPDGSFPTGIGRNTAVSSLAVMAFLARGYSPGLAPYGDVMNRGVDYVISLQRPDGVLIGDAGQMYSHNIATLMLSEVSGMVDPERQKRVDAALAKALKVILAAQDVSKDGNNAGGWRYEPNSRDSDLSHSGWALMALRSARNNGAAVPKDAIDRAVAYLLKCRNQDGSFNYQPSGGGGGQGLARAGAGLLCLELTGRHRDEVNMSAGQFIVREFNNRLRAEFAIFYAIYYAAQGMFQLGGEEWEKFAPVVYDTVLGMQTGEGYWEGREQEGQAGRCYSTSMAILALSVNYRQLPIYQR
jgi:hypothetical protein